LKNTANEEPAEKCRRIYRAELANLNEKQQFQEKLKFLLKSIAFNKKLMYIMDNGGDVAT
jgi:hypothetical protein